jgi:transketolase
MRNALAQTLYEIAKRDPRIVVIVADISPAGAMDDFRREFPDRFYNVGVAEQAAMGLAAGLAMRGFKPFVYSIATFMLYRAFEFIRVDLAYQDLPVTVVGMGAGLSYSTLGATHQAVEDVAVAMAVPNLTVLAPCDPAETAECARWCAGRESGGPVYMRIGKAGELSLTENSEEFSPGRMRWWGPEVHACGDVCVLSYGPIASVAAGVVRELRSRGLVAEMALQPFLAPLHETNIIEKVLHYFDHVVIIEEAINAPLAARVKGLAVDTCMGSRGEDDPSLVIRSFALPREFCPLHGTREELLDHYGLTAEKIVAALR